MASGFPVSATNQDWSCRIQVYSAVDQKAEIQRKGKCAVFAESAHLTPPPALLQMTIPRQNKRKRRRERKRWRERQVAF